MQIHRSPKPDRTGEAAAGCSACVMFPIAAVATLACVGLVKVGNANRWSSDGPGILFVMLAVLVTGGVAVAAWGGVLASLGLGVLARRH